MALQKTIYHDDKLIENAYIRIDFISGSKYNGWESTVGIYSPANLTHPLFVVKVRANHVINSVTEMYQYLRTSHPEFVNAANI